MRCNTALAILALSTATLAVAQQAIPTTPLTATPTASASTPSLSSSAAPNTDKENAHITRPKVITQTLADYPTELRDKKISGKCLVAFTVDTDGIPQSVHVVKGVEPTLDANAIRSVQSWRFKPALKDGKTPIPFDYTAEIVFRALDTKKANDATATLAQPKETSTPSPDDHSHFLHAVAIKTNSPKYPFVDRLLHLSGDCILGFVVDTNGVPQSIHIVKSIDQRLDASAIKAVSQWRYKPALKDGLPSTEQVVVTVKFRMH